MVTFINLYYRSIIINKQYQNKGNLHNMITFEKLFRTLKENGISQYSLYHKHGISRSQIQRLKNNQSVTTHTLDTLMNILGEGFTLDDIAEFKPDSSGENK